MKRENWFDRKFKLDLSDDKLKQVLKRLAETPGRIRNSVRNIPEELLNKKSGGKWSIKENIGHLVDLEELHSGRIDDFIDGKKILRPADIQNKKTDNANHNNKSVDYLIKELIKVREEFLRRFKSLNAEILNRKSVHPRLNQQMRPVDMAYFVAEHDENHIETIKEIIHDNQ